MKKISIILSILLSVTVFSSGASALSPAFKDVSPNAWYYDYVHLLAKEGVIDAGSSYRPEDGLNRVELLKMVIESTSGIEDYAAPSSPTFDDVPEDVWFTPYVEQAASLGIVYGYTDENGNLTGMFGPNDTVTRAEAAKILVNAFDISTDLDINSEFPDVNPGDWYHDYVVKAYNQSILDGYGNGNFGPNDPVTRAQIAKLIVHAQDPVERSDEVLWDGDVAPGFLLDGPEEAEEALDEEVEEEISEELEEIVPQATANLASIEESSVAAGSNEVFVAKYNFSALYEGFRVETVTVANDITGDLLGDQLKSTAAIKNVVLKFPDESGALVTESRPLGSDGTVRFTGLSFFVPRDKDTFFEVYAELNKLSDVGENLSGEVFRLGLQDTNHDDNTFRAVGDISDTVYGYGSSRLSVSSSQVEPFTVRKAMPQFSMNDSDENLSTGQNTLISFDVMADGGSIGLARLVFDVSVSENSGTDLSLSDFKLYRGSSYVDDVSIYDATGAQDLMPGGGSLGDGLAEVIVAFDLEETVASGDSQTYQLRANASGTQNDDSVNTGLAIGDEIAPLSGLTAINQENTGKVYVNGDVAAGIFTGANDFAQTLGTNHNIIWSDKSADYHLYPTVSGGIVTDDSGSYDWTNGYRLGLSGLYDHVISK